MQRSVKNLVDNWRLMYLLSDNRLRVRRVVQISAVGLGVVSALVLSFKTPHLTEVKTVVANPIVKMDLADVADLEKTEFVFKGDYNIGVFERTKEFVHDDPPIEVIQASYEVPNDVEGCKSYKKTWMDYRKVTRVTSDQYKLLNSEGCYTCEETGIRKVDNRFCIATATGYANKIGTKINLTMESGEVVRCILGDVKADLHTDPTHRFQKWDGSVAEMIIDGEVFKSTSQYPDILDGNIVRIDIVEEY